MQQEQETGNISSGACLCLHNMMRMRYHGLQNQDIDGEGDNHQIIPGAWRNGAVLRDMHNVQGGNRATRVVKAARAYLKHNYINIGSVT